MRREIPLLIAFVSGLAMILNVFSTEAHFKELGSTLPNWNAIIGAFAIFLALASLISVHGERISRRDDGWEYSVILLVTLITTLWFGFRYKAEEYYSRDVVITDEAQVKEIVGAAKEYDKIPVREQRLEFLAGKGASVGAQLAIVRQETLTHNLKSLADKGLSKASSGPNKGMYVAKVEYFNPFHWIYLYVYGPLQATMFSILAFYVASAAYRAFRARTVEGTLLLGAAFLVMLGRVPIGYMINKIFPWLPIPWIQEWIMAVPTTAGQRAIMIGAALGVVSTSLRMLLGYEQTYLGSE